MGRGGAGLPLGPLCTVEDVDLGGAREESLVPPIGSARCLAESTLSGLVWRLEAPPQLRPTPVSPGMAQGWSGQ